MSPEAGIVRIQAQTTEAATTGTIEGKKKVVRKNVTEELITYSNQLEEHRSKLQRSLTQMTSDFEDSQKMLNKIQKKLTKNCQKRVKNAF